MFVEAARHRLFLSCIEDDTAVFVVGRLDGMTLKISSCYILLNAAQKRQTLRDSSLWTMHL